MTQREQAFHLSGKHLKLFYQIGGITALLQLIVTLVIIGVAIGIGLAPTTAEGYFTMYNDNLLLGILRDDFTSVIIVGLYLGIFPALFLALRRQNPTVVFFSTLFTLIGVIMVFASHSGFSLMHLSKQYALASTATEQARFLAAGEAVMAMNIWTSTAGYIGGILLQGSGILISLVMLKSDHFGKVAAVSGLLANGFDLLQHILHPFWPEISQILMIFATFYLLWFLLMGLDLFKLARSVNSSVTEEN